MTSDRRDAFHTQPLLETGEDWARFVAGFMHELKTPLASLSMIAEMLVRENGSLRGNHAERYTVNLQELVREMQTLVQDTGTLARLVGKPASVAEDPVAVSELVQRATAAARSRGWEQGISLSTALEPGVPATIRTDRSLVEEALTRLLETGSLLAETQLVLRVAVSGDELVFTIEPDRGRVPERDLAGLFEPFSGGLSRTLSRRGGRSLAPALTRELARALGGDVEAVSEEERTVCVLRIPLDP